MFGERHVGPLVKPAKGSGLIARKEKRKAIVAAEEAEKALVRRRDVSCRWPKCEHCRRYKTRLEVAHVIRAKGMGGDHGTVSKAEDMMLLCYLVHCDQEQHIKRIHPLTERGTAGPCAFWDTDSETGLVYLVAEETAIGVYRRD